MTDQDTLDKARAALDKMIPVQRKLTQESPETAIIALSDLVNHTSKTGAIVGNAELSKRLGEIVLELERLAASSK